MLVAGWMLSVGCVFGSRPILPGDDYDAGAPDRTSDSGAFTGAPDAGAVPGLADAAAMADGGGNETLDSDVCIPAPGMGVADGGDAGYVLRDGGAPCDPAINVRDAGADASEVGAVDAVVDAPEGDGPRGDAAVTDADASDGGASEDAASDSAQGPRFDLGEGSP